MEKKTIDIAVLTQEYTELIKDYNSNIIILDEININLKTFLNIFFPYGDQFSIHKSILTNDIYYPLISLQSSHRQMDNKPFHLYETIISNIESDLQLPRECFTNDSLIKLRSEFDNFKSLLDLTSCYLSSSLTWSSINKMINEYPYDDQIVLAINIVFKTPTQGVKDNIVKIQYSINK